MPDVCSLLREIPQPLAAELRREGIPVEKVLLATDSDLDFPGNYAEQWLVITAERVMSFALDREGAHPQVDLPVADIESAQSDVRVGSGFLQAKTAQGLRNVIRFSNAQANKFTKAASKLKAMLKGTPLVATAEDDADIRRCPKCLRMLPDGTSFCPRCISKRHVFGRFFRLMTPYWPMAVTALILLVFSICLNLVPPRLTKTLIDNVLSEKGRTDLPRWFAWLTGLFSATSPLSWLALLVLCLATTQVCQILIHVMQGRLSTTIGTRITFDMRCRLFRHLQSLSVRYFDQNQVGTLMSRVAYDVDELQGFIWQLTNGFLYNILIIAGVLVVLFTMNAHLAFFVLIPVPFVLGSTYVFWRYVQPRYYRYWDSRSKIANVLFAALSGVRVVKAFAQEPREQERVQGYCQRLRTSRMSVDISASTFYPIVGFVFSAGGLIVWYVGGRDILSNVPNFTLGTLMAFFGYLGMFYGPLNSLMSLSQWLTSFTTQANRIFEVLDTEPEIQDAPDAKAIDMRGGIKVTNLVFGYNRYSPVLKGIDVEIKPGEMIGVVGHSGSGKTSFVNLLCRFYDPTEGRITIDGVDLRKIQVESVRSQIGLVLQDAQLFTGTIQENIAYGRPTATVEEVFEAAKAGNAHDFIVRMPDGYDTRLGERGSGLSGGERQRISIARALLFNPRILIHDEATSNVDTVTERELQKALEALTSGRTTIAIAHRLSTLRNADRIFVFEEGKIVETGTHEDLLARDGLYAKMVKIQTQLTQDKESVDDVRAVAEEEDAKKTKDKPKDAGK